MPPRPRDYRFWPEIAHLPGWIQMINEQEFSLICQKFASGPHIASDRHRAGRTHFEAAPWALQTRAEAAPTADLADIPQSRPQPSSELPPAHWGDPAAYEFRPVHAKWYLLFVLEMFRFVACALRETPWPDAMVPPRSFGTRRRPHAARTMGAWTAR